MNQTPFSFEYTEDREIKFVLVDTKRAILKMILLQAVKLKCILVMSVLSVVKQ